MRKLTFNVFEIRLVNNLYLRNFEERNNKTS